MAEKNNQMEPNLYRKITNPRADDPLSVEERLFINAYIKHSNLTEAARALPDAKGKSAASLSRTGKNMLDRPNVQAELRKIMEEIKQENIATAEEVMKYFTAVMRGDVKDQFGLDAPLSERTKAAQELARRTIDIENRKEGNADQMIAIKLDWSRDTETK